MRRDAMLLRSASAPVPEVTPAGGSSAPPFFFPRRLLLLAAGALLGGARRAVEADVPLFPRRPRLASLSSFRAMLSRRNCSYGEMPLLLDSAALESRARAVSPLAAVDAMAVMEEVGAEVLAAEGAAVGRAVAAVVVAAAFVVASAAFEL